MTNPSEPSGSSVPEAARAAAAGFSAERVREWSAAIQGVELAAPWHLVAACIDKADAEVAAAVAEERATTERAVGQVAGLFETLASQITGHVDVPPWLVRQLKELNAMLRAALASPGEGE